MGTHSGRTYLNSCIKVPIDPCNNCPAPIYNRPKLYKMGKQTKVKSHSVRHSVSEENARVKTKTLDSLDAQQCNTTGIRSLAKFYDSIPDYCDVKHLQEAEFYSTLETLRSTSRELRTEPSARCTSAEPKGKAKKRQSKKKKSMRCSASSNRPILPDTVPVCLTSSSTYHKPPADPCPSTTAVTPVIASCLGDEYDKCMQDLSRLKTFKHDFALEVEDFKRTLKDFEMEFKRTETNIREKKRPKPPPPSISNVHTQTHPLPGMHTAERARCRREMLRRCFSVTEMGSLSAPPTTTATATTSEPPVTHTERTAEVRLSNYFPSNRAASSDVPKVQIESPSGSSKRSSSATSSRLRGQRGRTKYKIPSSKPSSLSLCVLESPKRSVSHANSTASPIHPVARPNLAATLRAEVSRKKVKDLKNNCTYHDTTPQFDWEVRKTPAWKSLSLNESHKALLSIRLATRKAEQALQERQYELHMEMMRQRVKSAPLLLEGPTYWGPDVGKLSHTCHDEGIRHTCEPSKRSSKKKCSNRHNHRINRCASATTTDEGRNSAKLQQLRKIYGSGDNSTTHHKSATSRRQSQRACRRESENQTVDSGDDLCSVDRAFL